MSLASDLLPRAARLGGLIALVLAGAHCASAAPADCSRIAGDAQRLACYDREFPPQAAQAQAPASGSKGWRVRAAASPAAGRGDASASRASESEIQCRWIRPRRVQLTIQCKDNVTSVSFETGCYMTSSQYRSYGYVTYELDKGGAGTAHMVAGPDNHSLGFWAGDTAIPFIRELLGKSRLTVKMTPYAEDPVSAAFDLRGLEEAIKPVRRQCGW